MRRSEVSRRRVERAVELEKISSLEDGTTGQFPGEKFLDVLCEGLGTLRDDAGIVDPERKTRPSEEDSRLDLLERVEQTESPFVNSSPR